MQQQFAKDQQRDSQAQSIGAEQVTLMDCIGYDTNVKSEPINIVVNSSNSVISSAGQIISTPTTVTINIQDQCIHYLHRYAVSFKVNCINGFFENGMNVWQAKQFTFAKGKTVTTGNSQYHQQQMLYTRKKTDILRHAKGLGLKIDDFYGQSPLNIPTQLPANPLSLANNAALMIFFSTYLQGLGYPTLLVIATDAAGNQATSINTQIITPLRDAGFTQIPLLTAGEIAAASIDNNYAYFLRLKGQVQLYQPSLQRWQAYQNSLLVHTAGQQTGLYNPLAGVYEFVVPLHYIFTELDSPEFEAYLCHNGNTLQLAMTNIDASLGMIALGPNPSYNIDSLSLIQVMSTPTEQCLANVMRSNILYRAQRGYSMFSPCSENMTLVGAVPSGSKVHGIYFSFHPNQQYPSQPILQSLCDVAGENLVSQLPAGTSNIVYPLGFMPAMNIQQTIITVGGITRICNFYMLQSMDQSNWSIGGETTWASNALQRQAKQVYFIPLDRASEDLFGNSSLGPSPLNLQIILKPGRTLSGQFYDWINAPVGANVAALQRFMCYAYVKLVEISELDKGVWK